jgi:hypothetical protein
MPETTKGQPGGECGRLLCKCIATWRDEINERCICSGCALDANRFHRALGHVEPCTEISPSPVAAASEYAALPGSWEAWRIT